MTCCAGNDEGVASLWFGIVAPGNPKHHVNLQYLAFDKLEQTYVLTTLSGKSLRSGICGTFGKKVFDVKKNVRVMRDMFTKAELHECTTKMQTLTAEITTETAQTKQRSAARATEKRNILPQCDPDLTPANKDLNSGAAVVSTDNVIYTKRARQTPRRQ